MIRGLAASAQGMQAQLAAQDVIANNLANVSTAGFEREVLAFRSGGAAGKGETALTPEASVDASQGVLHATGNPGDVAIRGNGYMVAAAPEGNRLFRGGSLHAVNGQLATADGAAVLGSDGSPITVGTAPFTIGQDGAVTAAGKSVGKLQILVPTGGTTPAGRAMLTATSARAAAPGEAAVAQGYVEQSNVEPVTEMVNMIGGVRAYESNAKAVQSQDETLQSLFELLKQ